MMSQTASSRYKAVSCFQEIWTLVDIFRILRQELARNPHNTLPLFSYSLPCFLQVPNTTFRNTIKAVLICIKYALEVPVIFETYLVGKQFYCHKTNLPVEQQEASISKDVFYWEDFSIFFFLMSATSIKKHSITYVNAVKDSVVEILKGKSQVL